MSKGSVLFSWVCGVFLCCLAFAGCVQQQRLPHVPRQKAYIDARTTLRQAADDPDPVTRANAMEALAQSMGIKAGPVLQQALSDESPMVRFAAAMAIGDSKYERAKPILQGMAQPKDADARAEPDKRVFCAVIYALHSLGDISFTGELGVLLFDDEKEVRANTSMILGRMGEPSAKVPLRQLMLDERDISVQLQIVEALALLGDNRYMSLLEAYTKTQYLEDRLVAIGAMERVRSTRSPMVLRQMLVTKQPPRVRVAAAGGLARLGEITEEFYELCFEAVQNPRKMLEKRSGPKVEISQIEVGSLQRLGAISLGWMENEPAVDLLHQLLDSNDGGVRVAGAMSILRLLESYGEVPVEPKAPDTVAKDESEPQPKAEPESKPAPEPKPLPQLHTAGGKD